MSDSEQFRLQLVDWRRDAGLTQEAAAEVLGISQAGLSLWESGKRFPRGPLRRAVRSVIRKTAAVNLESNTI